MLPFLPRGKGIWIRRISACENGELDAIIAKVEAARYTHVFLKIADGGDFYNLDPLTQRDRAVDLTVRLHAASVDVWGWHYIYGDKPLFKSSPHRANYHMREADCAVQRVKRLQAAGLRGYVIDAEGEYKRIPDRAEKAAQFMEIVRQGLGDFPIGLTSWKLPNAHRSFPWEAFRSRCDLDLPQVFWIGRHGEAAKQLETSLKQFSGLEPGLPYLPAGPAFFEDNWRPSPDEIVTFLEKALDLGLPAASLWSWDHLGLTGEETTDDNPERLDFRQHWQAAADFAWREVKTDDGRRTTEEVPAPEPTPEPEPIPEPDLDFELEALVPPEAEDELPEWLEFLNRSETETLTLSEPAPIPEPEPDFAIETEGEDELPEWLQFLNEPETETLTLSEPAPVAEPEPVSAVETEGEEELPDWLQFLNEPQTPAEASAPPTPETELISSAAEETAEDLPEWLQFDNLPKPELPFETTASPSEPSTEPTIALTAEPSPEVSQSAESEPPQTDVSPAPSEPSAEPTPEVSQPAESEPTQAEFAPAPAEPSAEPAFAFTTESTPEVSQPAASEPPQTEFASMPSMSQAPKPIFFTPPAQRASPQSFRLPKRAAARVSSSPSTIHRSDTISQLFDALRNGEPELAVTFYGPGFVHVNSDRVEHDPTALAGFYASLLEQLEGRELAWSVIPIAHTVVSVKWNTLSRAGKSVHGTDTFHLNHLGQIIYHHTSFRIENGATP